MSKESKFVDVEKQGGNYVYSIEPLSKFTKGAEYDERLVTFSFIESVIKSLTGQFFTAIDASIANTEQNKAVKDIIRRAVSSEYEHISNFTYDQELMSKCATEYFEEAEKNGEVIESVDLVDELLKN